MSVCGSVTPTYPVQIVKTLIQPLAYSSTMGTALLFQTGGLCFRVAYNCTPIRHDGPIGCESIRVSCSRACAAANLQARGCAEANTWKAWERAIGWGEVTSGTDHRWLKPKDKGMSDDNLAHCHRWSFGCRTVGCYNPCNVSLVHDRSLQNFQDWNYFESSVKRLLP